jgi:hypothetical protein
MRDYAKVSPHFWTGKTGKALKSAGAEAVIVGLYLMTSPHANMIGLYHCPITYISYDTGLTFEGASKGLASAIEADFCTYEAESEYVFVHEFAAYQIGEELDTKDNRVKGVMNELAKCPKGQCWQAFRARYSAPFNLPLPAEVKPKKVSPSKAPSKPGAGAGEETGTEKDKYTAPEARELCLSDLLSDGVERGNAQAWAKVRKAKRAGPLTALAWGAVKREAVKAGLTANEAVKKAAEKGWIGFDSDWLHKPNGFNNPQATTTSNAADETAAYLREQATRATGPIPPEIAQKLRGALRIA